MAIDKLPCQPTPTVVDLIPLKVVKVKTSTLCSFIWEWLLGSMFPQHSYKTSPTTYSSGIHHGRIKEYKQGADPFHVPKRTGEMTLGCQEFRKKMTKRLPIGSRIQRADVLTSE